MVASVVCWFLPPSPRARPRKVHRRGRGDLPQRAAGGYLSCFWLVDPLYLAWCSFLSSLEEANFVLEDLGHIVSKMSLKQSSLGEQPGVPAGPDSPRDPGIGSVTAQVRGSPKR